MKGCSHVTKAPMSHVTPKGPYPLGPSVAKQLVVAGRTVGSEISNMLDISRWSPCRPAMVVARQSVAQSPNK